MNIEQLVFTMYKDENFQGRKDLRDKIKKQFKDITEKQLNEITLRIYNYQVDKYNGQQYNITPKWIKDGK